MSRHQNQFCFIFLNESMRRIIRHNVISGTQGCCWRNKKLVVKSTWYRFFFSVGWWTISTVGKIIVKQQKSVHFADMEQPIPKAQQHLSHFVLEQCQSQGYPWSGTCWRIPYIYIYTIYLFSSSFLTLYYMIWGVCPLWCINKKSLRKMMNSKTINRNKV